MSIDTNQNSNSGKRKLLNAGAIVAVLATVAVVSPLINNDMQHDNPEILAELQDPAEQTTDSITVTPLKKVVDESYTTMLDGLDTLEETVDVLKHVHSEIDDVNNDYLAERQEQAAAFETVANNHLTRRFLDEIGDFLPEINLDEAIDLTRTEMAIVNEYHEGIEYQESRIKTVIETTATVFSDHLAKTHDDPSIIPLARESADKLAQALIAEIHYDNVVTGFLDEIRNKIDEIHYDNVVTGFLDEIRNKIHDEIPAEKFLLNRTGIDEAIEILLLIRTGIDDAIETTRKNMEQINNSARMVTGSLKNSFILEKTVAEFADALDALDILDDRTSNKIFMISHRHLDVMSVSRDYKKDAISGIIPPGPSIDRELSDVVAKKMRNGDVLEHVQSELDDYQAERQEQAAAFETVANNHLTRRFLDEIGDFLPEINLDEAIDLTKTEMAMVNESHEGIEYQESRIKTVIETTATVFSDHLAKTHDDPSIIPLARESADKLAQDLIAEIHYDNVVTGFLDKTRDIILNISTDIFRLKRTGIDEAHEIFLLNRTGIDEAIKTTRKNMEQINNSARMVTGSLKNSFILEKTAAEFKDALNIPDDQMSGLIFNLTDFHLAERSVSRDYKKDALAGIIPPGPSIDRELSDDVAEKMRNGEFVVSPFSDAGALDQGTKIDDDDFHTPTVSQ